MYLVPFNLANGLVAEFGSSAGSEDLAKHPPVVLQQTKPQQPKVLLLPSLVVGAIKAATVSVDAKLWLSRFTGVY